MALDLGTLEGRLRFDYSDLEKAEMQAGKFAKKVDKDFSKIARNGEKLKGLGKAATVGITAPLAAAAVASTKFASDLNETLSKTDAIFGSSADDMKKWGDSAAKNFGLSKRAALDASTQFGIALKQIGGNSNSVSAKISKDLVGLSSDLNSFYNRNDSQDAIFSALTGEFEPLKKLGVVLNETIVKQKALTMGLGDGKKALSAEAKQAAVLAILMEKTKDAHGDFAKTAGGLANKTRILKARFEDNSAAIGQRLLPIAIKLLEWVDKGLDAFDKLSPSMQNVAMVVGLVGAAIGPVVIGLGTLLTTFGPMIASAGGFSAALGSLAAAAGPVGLAIAAIAAGAIILYQNWDVVKQFFIAFANDIVASFQNWAVNNEGLINSIQAKWTTFVEGAKALWTALTGAIGRFVSSSVEKLNQFLEPIGGIKGAWEILKAAIGGVITYVVKQLDVWLGGVNKVIGIITDVLNGNMSVWEGLGQIIGVMVTTAVQILTNMKDQAVSIFNSMADFLKNINWKQLGIDIMNGLKNGILAGAEGAKNAIKGVAKGLKDSVTDFFQIKSPSRVFNAIGKFLTAGLAGGITEGKVDAINAAVKLAEDVMNGTKDKFKNLESSMLSGGGGFGFGGGDIVSNINGIDHDMEKEKAIHAQQLELLKQAEAQKIEAIRPYQEMREQLEREHQSRLQGFEQEKQQQILATADSFFGGLAQLQSSHSKKAQAVGKAAAIAQTTIKTYEGAMSAYAAMAPIPFIGPALGIAAAGAVVAMGAQNIAKIRSSKAKGGSVFSGGQYRVNENGPEMLSTGGQDYLMMGNKGGNITPFEQLKSGGSGGSNVNVNIKVNNNFAEAEVSVTETGEGDSKTIEIAVDRAVKRVTSELDTGGTDLSRTLENRYKLGRTG